MIAAISKHIDKSFRSSCRHRSDVRRLQAFIDMLNERRFRLLGAIDCEEDYFYRNPACQPVLLFLFEASSCPNEECQELHFEHSNFIRDLDYPLELETWQKYLHRFVTKYKNLGGSPSLIQLEEGVEEVKLPDVDIHGVWLITSDPHRPVDLTTVLLVPKDLSANVGRDLVYTAVDHVFNPF